MRCANPGPQSIPYPPPLQVTSKSDVFSLGVILLELIAGWRTQMEKAAAIARLRRDGEIDPILAQRRPYEVRLVRRFTAAASDDRPSCADVISELWRDHKSLFITQKLRQMLALAFTDSVPIEIDLAWDADAARPWGDVCAYGRVREALARALGVHGAVEFDAPLLIPRTKVTRGEGGGGRR